MGAAVREAAAIKDSSTYELWSVPSFDSDKPDTTKGKDIGSSKFRIQPGDVLVCKINPRINRVWLVREPTNNCEQIASTEWVVIRLDKSTVSAEWLVYYLSGPKFRKWIVSEVSGATGSHTRARAEDMLKQAIWLPPLLEQQRIVAVLDEVFAGLATATANAEKNLKNARELFESYLRFILTSGEATWEKKRLSEVAQEFGRGKSKHRPRNDPKLYGGPYPFVQTGDISNASHWLTDYTQTYSALGLAQSRLWPKRTVCIAIVGATVGETAILDVEACFPDSVIGVVVDEAVADTEYVEYLLQAFKAVLKEKGKGTARDNINLGTFENQLFPFPTLEEQRLIVARLNELAAHKSELEGFYTKRLDGISELRQSILQRAFSGELTSPRSHAIKEAAE
jgi:type I restriction enzyme S subunit